MFSRAGVDDEGASVSSMLSPTARSVAYMFKSAGSLFTKAFDIKPAAYVVPFCRKGFTVKGFFVKNTILLILWAGCKRHQPELLVDPSPVHRA